jgi:hypothetical protein
MHFSGWSKVSLGGTTGWILSNELTQNTPKILAKVVDKNTIIKLQSLEEELLKFKTKKYNSYLLKALILKHLMIK